MKRLYFLLAFLFLFAGLSQAKGRQEAAILIESQRGEVFQLAIGGRMINAVAADRVAVGDLPPGRHLVDIRVIGRGRRALRIRAEVVLRGGYETVFVLEPVRRGHTLILTKVEELPLRRPIPPLDRGPEICRYVMDERDVDRTLRLMEDEGFDDRRLEIAKGEIRLAGGIMTEDLYQLIKALSFEDRRITLAKYAYDYVCDQREFSRVVEAFEFSSSKREMQDFIYNRR